MSAAHDADRLVRIRVCHQQPDLRARADELIARLAGTLGVAAEAIPGRLGEFSVLVGNEMVAKKGWLGVPSTARLVAAVRAALPRGA
ncbi:MAG: hypothetical protein NW201_08670 [Gemmatimonadales bacterium]|nr:hypothetical protein [Gemmatimonadales bacterium]